MIANWSVPRVHYKIWAWLFWVIIGVIVLSPVIFWATGIGQNADSLSAEITRQTDGTLLSSPKAQAYHELMLPMRLERMLIYPLLLLSFQFSGGAIALCTFIEKQIEAGPLTSIRKIFRRWPQQWQQRLTPANLLTICIFILVLNLVIFLLYLPFNFYRGFMVSHQFGLSTQTVMSWFSDWGKSVLIDLLIAIGTWITLYGFMKLLPRRWPLPVGGLMVIFLFIFTLLTPTLITPLFYKVSPLENNDLRTRILTLTQRAGMSADEIYVIDASSKTTEVNAYVTAFGDQQRIVLFDTLINDYTPDQVEVVLAHELGHWYYHHVLLSLMGIGAVGWIGLFGLRWLLDRLWPWLGLRSPSDIAGLPFILALIFLTSTLSLPIENSFSRFGEHQADVFALTVSQKPDVFVSLFQQIAEQNLSIVDPPAWEKFIFYTHPSIAERIHFAERFQAD